MASKLPVVPPTTHGGGLSRWLGLAVPIAGVKIMGIVCCNQPRVPGIAANLCRLRLPNARGCRQGDCVEHRVAGAYERKPDRHDGDLSDILESIEH